MSSTLKPGLVTLGTFKRLARDLKPRKCTNCQKDVRWQHAIKHSRKGHRKVVGRTIPGFWAVDGKRHQCLILPERKPLSGRNGARWMRRKRQNLA